MSRLKRTLVLWVLGYFEPGRATAAAHGMCEPFGFHRGVGTPLVPGFPHRFGTRCRRTLFGVFRLFGIHIPLKNMDICGRKVPYGAWSRGADCRRRSRCTRDVFGRPTADNVKRSLSPLCRA